MANLGRRFEGQVALVTGASRGIGRAIAVRLASEGAHVVINHFRGADTRFPGAAEEAQRLAHEAGGEASLYEADMSDTAAVRKMIRGVAAELGRLDVLVNNAGICPMVEFLAITEEIWDQVHDLNLRAVFFATQEAARLMMENKTRGRIVCISSISGEFPATSRPTSRVSGMRPTPGRSSATSSVARCAAADVPRTSPRRWRSWPRPKPSSSTAASTWWTAASRQFCKY